MHSPEFGFEHDLDNVRRAVDELDVRYPVVLDNDFAIWQSLGNRSWPAVYLVDGDGRVRFHHFGEGNYEETERAIQELLGVDEETVRVEAGGVAEAGRLGTLWPPRRPTWASRRGQRRAARRAPTRSRSTNGRWTARGRSGTRRRCSTPPAARSRTASRRATSTWSWRRRRRAPRCASPCSWTAGRPGNDHGVDVDESGEGAVSEPRMYQLVRQRRGVSERTFEITFLDPGVRAYVFTFG